MRLIDADALKQNEDIYLNLAARNAVDDAPTVDAVKVVRCADCRHHGESNETLMDGKYKRCAVNGAWHTGSWYCASGERKEECARKE